MPKAMSAKVDAFDQWCLRRILCNHCSKYLSNAEVRHHHRLSTSVQGHPFSFACLVTLRVLAWNWINIAKLFMPPSTTLHGIGKGREDARHISGPELSRPTLGHVTLAFTLPGIERRTEMHGADLCRQLYPSLESALGDDESS